MPDAIQGLQKLLADRQHNRLLRLSFPNSDGPDAELLVNSLDAVEGLSRPFDYTLELLSDDAHIHLKDLQGKMLSVQLVRKDGTLRYFTGRVFRFSLKKVDGGLAYYEAKVGPWLNYLSLRKDNYLFHEASLYDQTASIFSDYGALPDWDWRVATPPKPMTDACQFDETDANYLARRWAAAGLVYWFEHTEAGHKLVISDGTTAAEPVDGDPEVPYQRHGGAIEEDGIGDWSPSRQLVHGSVALTSYDFKSGRPAVLSLPTLNQQGDVPVIESYEYTGAFGFKDLADGDALARLRMQEIEARGKQFEGAGNCRQMMPGRWFRLTGHFDDAAGAEASEFLVIETTHKATNNYQVRGSTPHYENRISCLRRLIPWRPGRSFNCTETKIYGIQTATVVGPKGEEIHTDEYGRVRVQFHWDREGQNDERSSAWIRVATPWAGANFGMTSIPRIGTEVIVSFMDGNPDRPIITGMIPNVDTMPAWSLPANKTQTGLMSRSTPGGGVDNANALRFEDKKGSEQLWMQAERNLDTVVKNDETKGVGGNRTLQVGANHTIGIGGNVSHTVGGTHTEVIKRNMTLDVTEGRQDSTIKGDVTITSTDGEITVTSPHKITLVVGGSSITMTPEEIVLTAGNIFLNP
ncbi:type VI secretion system Vgr family protein [Pseudoduganella chitinolytica]|uniref:Type VI secretion system tip protein TssI/VgrG n=1 Tax=Pseudoduganella chitinolytica TaxID=34070 RepID=A0ABY8BDK2_9BURK|nr:type VI secretion system tip protein TssI/VgrG [Pseudoduganella chitinolytica]WEF32424.1 type VI secretion system tip protein TssI/VgrG [Pseudoduganella chitinolytica]